MSDGEATARPSRRLLAGLGAMVLLIACAGYGWTGSPSALSGNRDSRQAVPHPVESQPIAAMVEQLAARLQQRPDDGRGWALLGRSNAALGRAADAVTAYAKALALIGDEPNLLADYADVLAVHNRSLAGEPTRLIERALAIEPRHPKALLLAGTAAFDRRDYAAAVVHWENIGDAASSDAALAQQLRAGIAEARERGRLPAVAAATPARGDAVSGVVSLAPALAAKVGPDDTVFVFARAAEGPRLPLAILRKRARELPFDFRLDDSMAMAAQARLSAFDKVIVTARVSRSGNALPQDGDLIGQSAAVAPGATGLRIEVSDVVSGAR